jgi:FKBP-type peptidyl-prolyl cis-trans isomerase (trigger factor)
LEITLNKLNNTEGVIKIRLTEGDYQPHVEEKVKDYSRKANIKGFRQGKVPAGVIKKMFGKSILVDEVNQVLTHKLTEYIRENNLKILGEPLPNQELARQIDWDSQKDFEFEYQIGMIGDFQYNLSKDDKVIAFPIEVDDKVINETIEDLKIRFGKVSYPEASEAGDNLFGELRSAETKEDGEPAFKKEFLSINTNKVDKAVQPKFLGVKKDDVVEFELEKAFTNKEALTELLGESEAEAKAVKGPFQFKVANVTRTQPAELNQELFDRVFGKDTVTTEEEFIAKVRETIAENYQRESQHFLDHNIEDYFLANTNIDLPEDFLKTWLKARSDGKVTDAVLEEEFDAYKRSLKWDIVKNRIADDHNISVETEEVRDRAKQLIISQFGGQAFADQIADRLDGITDNYLQHEDGQNFMKLYNQLRSEKILNYIKEQITIEEKKVSVDEFRKITAEHTH